MIHWQNTKNPKMQGVAKDKDHYDRLKKLANGHLKIVSITKDVSKDTKILIDEVKADQPEEKTKKTGSRKKDADKE